MKLTPYETDVLLVVAAVLLLVAVLMFARTLWQAETITARDTQIAAMQAAHDRHWENLAQVCEVRDGLHEQLRAAKEMLAASMPKPAHDASGKFKGKRKAIAEMDDAVKIAEDVDGGVPHNGSIGL